MIYSKRILLVCLILCLLFIAACSSGGNQRDLSGTLKILIDPGSQQFLSHVRSDFLSEYPDIEIVTINIADIVEDPFDFNQDFAEVIKNQQPDVIISSSIIY